jgi:hypothetical protein
MPTRFAAAAFSLAAAVALAAPAAAQAPGMVPGVHDVHLKGIGKVRFGMTVKQARDAAGVHMTKGRVNQCTYLTAGPPRTGQGPTLMFVRGKLRSVHTRRPRGDFATPKGVDIGTPVRRVRHLYPGGFRTDNIGAPEGFNLVWKRGRNRRLVFEISNGRVFGMRSGMMPWVMWQECA